MFNAGSVLPSFLENWRFWEQKDDLCFMILTLKCQIATYISCKLTCYFLVQEFLVAVGLRGATLQHRILPSGLSWHEQVRLLRFRWLLLQFQYLQTKTWWKRFMLGCVLLTYCALKSVICFLVSLWDHWQDCSLALKFLLGCSFASVPLHHPKSMPTTRQGGSVGFVPFFKKEAVHTGNFSSRVLSNYLDNLWGKKKMPSLEHWEHFSIFLFCSLHSSSLVSPLSVYCFTLFE